MNGQAQRSANGRNSPLWWAPHWAEKYQGTQWKLVIFVTKVTKLWPNIWNCMKPYILKGWFWAAHVSSIPQISSNNVFFQNTEATQDLLYIVSTPGSATPVHAVQTTLPEQTHAARDIWCPCWWSRSFRMEIVKSILHTRVMFPKWARTQEEKSCPQTRQTCSKTVKKQMLNSILTLLNFKTDLFFLVEKIAQHQIEAPASRTQLPPACSRKWCCTVGHAMNCCLGNLPSTLILVVWTASASQNAKESHYKLFRSREWNDAPNTLACQWNIQASRLCKLHSPAKAKHWIKQTKTAHSIRVNPRANDTCLDFILQKKR